MYLLLALIFLFGQTKSVENIDLNSFQCDLDSENVVDKLKFEKKVELIDSDTGLTIETDVETIRKIDYGYKTTLLVKGVLESSKSNQNEPLILTPLIEDGKVEEAKAAAKFCLKNVKGYSGYFTTNKTSNANMFFWYFPSEIDAENAPVILWLDGGPGEPLLYSAFELGPFGGREHIVKSNHSWSQFSHMIFVDNPVDVGFSFIDDKAGICKDDLCVGQNLYETVTQFFTMFPELRANDFFIASRSYGCKFAAALGYTIHNGNIKSSNIKINLKGLTIESGYCDPINSLDYGPTLVQLGLIDENTKEYLDKHYKDEMMNHITNKRWSAAYETEKKMFFSRNKNNQSYLQTVMSNIDFNDYAGLLQRDDRGVSNNIAVSEFYKKLIHVGNKPFNVYAFFGYLDDSHYASASLWMEELLDNYRVLFYNGQMDIVSGYPVTNEFIEKLNWCGSKVYLTNPRDPWWFSGKLAGYITSVASPECVGSLTQILFLNSGHYISRNNPDWVLDLIYKFTLLKNINNSREATDTPLEEDLPTEDGNNDDVGDALFLTPLIENGSILEAQKMAEVHLHDVKSYSGYLTIDKKSNANTFFWYFPSESGEKSAPIILWIPGGPGDSSLFGVLDQHGPFYVDDDLELNKTGDYWSKSYNVLYMDTPIGSGYSFTDQRSQLCQTDTCVGNHIYQSLIQFFDLFPELKDNEFYIATESYGCKFAACLGHIIHTTNPTLSKKINLKGLTIGNGFCDPLNTVGLGEFLYHTGLIDKKSKLLFEKTETKISNLIKNEKWVEANQMSIEMISQGSINETSTFENITSFSSYTNFSNYQFPNFSNARKFMVRASFRKSIHVGKTKFDNGDDNALTLEGSYMTSVAHHLTELANNYNLLFYNGQMDIVVAYPMTVNAIKHLDWCGAEAYKKAKRDVWTFMNEVAGYTKTASSPNCKGKLTEALVRNAGHTAPADAPGQVMDLITKFIKNQF